MMNNQQNACLESCCCPINVVKNSAPTSPHVSCHDFADSTCSNDSLVIGRDWKQEEQNVKICKGNHESSLPEFQIEQFWGCQVILPSAPVQCRRTFNLAAAPALSAATPPLWNRTDFDSFLFQFSDQGALRPGLARRAPGQSSLVTCLLVVNSFNIVSYDSWL